MFEPTGLGSIAHDHSLSVRSQQMDRSHAVGCGKDSELSRCGCDDFERLFGLFTVRLVMGVEVEPHQGDRGDRIAGGSGGILKGFSAGIQNPQASLRL